MPDESGTLRIGVVGLGFMGQTHVRAYDAARASGLPCRLAAVCDADEQRLAGRVNAAGNIDTGDDNDLLFNPDEIIAYRDPAALLSDPEVDLVSICTPTDTHASFATEALAGGKHVLVEKPVALETSTVRALRDTARASGTLCRPAMCMRFWPGWTWLKQAIEDNRFGPLRALSIQRLGARPGWGAAFYRDPARTGGALTDLHIHDADFVCWLLGAPNAVLARGDLDHVATQYLYDDGPALVFAEGGWLPGGAFPFRMRYVAAFEHATAEYDLLADHPLVLTREGHAEPVALPPGAGYDHQAAAMVRASLGMEGGEGPTLEDAVRVAVLLDAERECLRTGRPADIASE